MNTQTQVLVIGGGPAGSTAATLLTREGFDVTLVDKEVFPRYHIGESLLPICLNMFDILGVRGKIERSGFQVKYGTYFEWGDEQWHIDFLDEQENGTYGFQVDRASFDALLLDHAKSQGVKVLEGREIQSLSFEEDRPRRATWSQIAGERNTGKISFDYLIDASGRAGLMAMRYLKSRCYNRGFQNVAVWGYWKHAKQLAKGPLGATAVASVPQGWFWAIPLRDELLSVGLVIHKTAFQGKRKQYSTLEQLYLDAIRDCPLIAELVSPATLISSIRAEQDYSYTSTCFAGPGYFMLGDAACFLDPLLSTGVHLAMSSALLASASLASVLRGEIGEEEARAFYSHSYQQTYLRFFILVSSLYQQYRGKMSYFWEAQQLSRNDYAASDLQRAFTSIVSGLEDLKDTRQAVYDVVLKETSQAYAGTLDIVQHPEKLETMTEADRKRLRDQFRYIAALHEHPSSSRTVVDGLYIQLKPWLGLARTSLSF